MKVLPQTDVVIVGLGAAGGVAAHVLAKAGVKIVGLDAGPYLTEKDFIKMLDEIASQRNTLGDIKYNQEIPSWRANAGLPAGDPAFILTRMMNAVGGSSIHYGAQSWRMTPNDFRTRSETVKRYGEAALPPGSNIADWPLSYAELEHYYDLVEYSVGVSGSGGSNPFEGPRSREFPMPPVRTSGLGKLAGGAMRELGYHPFPAPAAVNSVNYDGRAACTLCGFCSGFPCWNESKSSTLVTSIREAELTGNLEIRPSSTMTRVMVDPSGRASGVQYRTEDGEIIEQPAKFVILASYTYENVRRLLMSTSDAYPRGLANNNGQVGKHYMSHIYVMINGLFPDMKLNLFNGTTAQAVVIDDFNSDNFDHSDLGFIRGGIVFTFSQYLPIGTANMIPPDVPKWGQAYKNWLRKNSNSVATLYSQIENLPYQANFLDLDPDKTDPAGDPLVRVTYDLYDNDKRAAAFVADRMVGLLQQMGAKQTWTLLPAIPQAIATHAFGGTRMGNDSAQSVVDRNSIAHEVPNLAILGGSTFPSTSGYMPTQTIQALSWRSAEYIAQNFDKIAAR